MSLDFSQESQKKIDALCERYPTKQPVLLAALHLAQKEFGHLRTEVLHLVAQTLDLSYTQVFGVVTFYTMFRQEPGGTNTLRVCTNISCMLRGAYDVLDAICQETGLAVGESNDDFTVVEEECLAACANAPCLIVGTKYFLDVEPEQVADILAELKKSPRPESEVV